MSRRLAFVLVAVLVAASVALPAIAQDLEDDLDQIGDRIDRVASQIDSAAANRSTLAEEVLATQGTLDVLLAEVGRTEFRLTQVQDQVRAQQIQLSGVRNELRDLYAELAETQARLDRGRADAEDWVRLRYMTAGEVQTGIALAAAHLTDVTLGFEYLAILSQETDEVILRLETLRQLERRQAERAAAQEAELEREAAELAIAEAELSDVAAQLAGQRADLEAELYRERDLLADVDREIAHFEGELAALEKEQARIEAAITAEASTAAESAGGGDAGGSFIRPVPGSISSGFGPRLHPILGFTRMHTGLDFSSPYGQVIAAAAGGRVILAGSYGGYGNTVVIDHGDGVTTLYAHQSTINVAYDQLIAAGDLVGFVGSTGLSTGPHLHFEVRIGGVPVDPMGYL